MEDYAVHGVQVSDETGINAAFQPTVQKKVTYYVGGNGPFFLYYDPAQFTSAKVLEDMARAADTLRAIGARPTSGV